MSTNPLENTQNTDESAQDGVNQTITSELNQDDQVKLGDAAPEPHDTVEDGEHNFSLEIDHSNTNQEEQTDSQTNTRGIALVDDIIQVLKTIYDPEIPVDIYELGLIYKIRANTETGCVNIEMTLTSPGCPVAQTFPGTVEGTILCLPNVKEAYVEIVWDPPWSVERMTEAAKLKLGMY